jgi:triosephosphate isomerase (TIM)
MRKTIVAGNWKMNLTAAESARLARELLPVAATLNKTEMWVAPSFTALWAVKEVLGTAPVSLGAQNCHWEERGAYTGETSPSMLHEFGCSFALVGHSERRHVFKESEELVSKRVRGAVAHGLTAVLCIGETLAEREAGETESVLAQQLKASLGGDLVRSAEKLVIAYEPVWAIGTGKVASIPEIAHAHSFIHSVVEGLEFPQLPILYGGSVTPDNFSDILSVPTVGGALVGGASLDAAKFIQLLRTSEGISENRAVA